MAQEPTTKDASTNGGGRRVSASGDLEVSTYLEIAREREGERAETPEEQRVRPETVVVLDFGSQYSMLIARRVRECHVYCEMLPYNAPQEEIGRLRPRAFILSGGPASVYEEGAPQAPAYVFEAGLPVLGRAQYQGLVPGHPGGPNGPGGDIQHAG